MIHQAAWLLPCAAWFLLDLPTTSADTFRFKDGRVIAGTLKSKSEKTIDGKPQALWAIEIEPGTFIQIDPGQLDPKSRQLDPDAVEAYLTALQNLPETADAHYEFAGWCVNNGLRDFEEAHYLRALDLDPNHGPANTAAGNYKNSDGRWVKKERVMGSERGKVRHGNAWRFPGAIAIEQAEEERRLKQAEATKDLLRWHVDAISNSGKRQALALENLAKVSDPLTVSMLTELLQGKRKPVAPPALRILYVNILARIQTAAAAQALARVSVNDAEPQVRNAAMDALTGDMRLAAIPVFVGYLKNKNNALVNRAAEALGQLRAEQAVLPLIEALVTKHTRTVGGGNTNYNASAMTFGAKEQVQEYAEQNPSVLGTLAQLTGQNYDYIQPQWLAWYASVYAPPADDLRRDP